MEVPSSLAKIQPLPARLIDILHTLAQDESPSAPEWPPTVSSTPDHAVDPIDSELCTVAVATGMHTYVRSALASAEPTRYWRYLLACGFVCREIAMVLNRPPELAFACGMLHDLGRLALMAAYPT